MYYFACKSIFFLLELNKFMKGDLMANIKSSKKAIKVIAKKTLNNHELKARVKNNIRLTDKEIASGNKENATKLFLDTQKVIDRALSKGLIKANTANREKSRLSKKIKEMA